MAFAIGYFLLLSDFRSEVDSIHFSMTMDLNTFTNMFSFLYHRQDIYQTWIYIICDTADVLQYAGTGFTTDVYFSVLRCVFLLALFVFV